MGRLRVIPKKKRRIIRATKRMKTPYGLEVIESCLACPMLKDRLFCNLPQRTIEGLDAISSSATYPKGAVLFVEGQAPRGVFVLCNGRVKLSASSTDGKSLILRIADPGEVVGLPGTISGKPYEATAEALEPIQANFIPREASGLESAFAVFIEEPFWFIRPDLARIRERFPRPGHFPSLKRFRAARCV